MTGCWYSPMPYRCSCGSASNVTVVRAPPPGSGSYLRALSRSAPPSSASLNSSLPAASVKVSSQRPSHRGMRAVTVMPPLVREADMPSSAMAMVGAGVPSGGGSSAQSASAIGCMSRARTRTLFAPHGSMRTVSPSPTQVRASSAAVNGEVMVMEAPSLCGVECVRGFMRSGRCCSAGMRGMHSLSSREL